MLGCQIHKPAVEWAMIYLDHAATSFPKAGDCLYRALDRYLQIGASPGRGGYDRAVAAAMEVNRIRRRLAAFFGAGDQAQVCFAAGATDALNMLIQGLLSSGDHVISSRLEHNSVLRPLYHLQQQGRISCDLVPFNKQGFLDLALLTTLFRPKTRLVILNHASNVLGTIQPIAEIGSLCRQRGVPLIIDAAQSAGCIPIAMQSWDVQGLAFTGHKALLGPTGIGGLIFSAELQPQPTRFGGTGIDSLSPNQPLAYPERLEAGTINLLGILGLDASLDYVEAHQEADYRREMALLAQLIDGLRALPRLRLVTATDLVNHLPVLSCTVEGMASADVGTILDGDYDIAVRTGLHCAPLVHTDLGSRAEGMVRFSLGPSTTETEITATIAAMASIAG